MVVGGGLTKKKERKKERKYAKGKEEKERYTHLYAEFHGRTRTDKKDCFSDQCREIEENNRMGKTRDFFKTIGDTKGKFQAKMGIKKDRNQIRSDQISLSVVSNSLRPHESQHARPPCPSPTPGVH